MSRRDLQKTADEIRRTLEVRPAVQPASPPVVNIDVTALAAKDKRPVNPTLEDAGRRRARRLAELKDRSFDSSPNSLFAILRDCADYVLSMLIGGFAPHRKREVVRKASTPARTTALQRRPVSGIQRPRTFGK